MRIDRIGGRGKCPFTSDEALELASVSQPVARTPEVNSCPELWRDCAAPLLEILYLPAEHTAFLVYAIGEWNTQVFYILLRSRKQYDRGSGKSLDCRCRLCTGEFGVPSSANSLGTLVSGLLLSTQSTQDADVNVNSMYHLTN